MTRRQNPKLLRASFLQRTGMIVGLASAILAQGCDRGNNQIDRVPAQNVPERTLVYADGPIKSYGFYSCSAVILDGGDRVLMAHATPGLDKSWNRDYDPSGRPFVNVGNVAEMIVREAKARNFNLENSFVVVNAGTEDSLQRITDDFAQYEIPIRASNTDLSPQKQGKEIARNVFYDPRIDLLEVTLAP